MNNTLTLLSNFASQGEREKSSNNTEKRLEERKLVFWTELKPQAKAVDTVYNSKAVL